MNTSINIKYILIVAIAVICSFFLHEFAHFITGKLLGYEMGMSLNSTFLLEGTYQSEWHQQLISAAGPIFTLLQAIVIFYCIQKTNNKYWYPFLFFAFYSRVFTMVISIFSLNNEAPISAWLGLEYWILPLLISFSLFFLLLKTSKEQKYNLKFNLINYFLTTVFITATVFSDQYIFT